MLQHGTSIRAGGTLDETDGRQARYRSVGIVPHPETKVISALPVFQADASNYQMIVTAGIIAGCNRSEERNSLRFAAQGIRNVINHRHETEAEAISYHWPRINERGFGEEIYPSAPIQKLAQ